MPHGVNLKLCKDERISSRRQIELLFTSGNGKSLSAFPLRVVYMPIDVEAGKPQAQFMVSVSKRCFKRAVDRNRVKRQLREAYRLNKSLLNESLAKQESRGVALAFIWLDHKLYDSSYIHRKVENLLIRVKERL